MKNQLLTLLVSVTIATPALAQSSHSVRGYVNKNGTYVAPHRQTNPDSTRMNNWSTKGNVNPYTGKVGTVDPYSTPKPKPSPYGGSSYGTTSDTDDGSD